MKSTMRKVIAWMLVFVLMSADVCAIAATLELPKALTIIDEEAFYGATSIDEVIVHDEVTEIRSKAFADSSLTEINLPESIEYIADDAFDGCEDVDVTVEDDTYAYDWAVDNEFITPAPAPTSAPSLAPMPTVTPTIKPVSEEYDYGIIDNSYVSITRYNGSDAEIVVPSHINGLPVKNIGWYAFSDCENLTSVDLPNTITTIEFAAFDNCRSLKKVILPSSLETADSFLFRNCSSLSEVVIPESLTSIDMGFFENCTSLKTIRIPSNVSMLEPSAFDGCTGLTDIYVDEDNEMYASIDGVLISLEYDEIVRYPSGRTEITYSIPEGEGLCGLGAYSFAGCNSLTSITIPAGVDIWDEAFSGCKNLKTVVLEEGVTGLSNGVFKDCVSLESVSIPESVTIIGNDIFEGCSSVIPVVAENSYAHKWCKANYFDCDLTPSISQKYEYEIIDDYYIKILKYLGKESNVVVPAKIDDLPVYEVSSYAFYQCSNIESIKLPRDVYYIGSEAFRECDNLTSIILPEDIVEISDSTFRECANLTSIMVPDGVTNIGHYAFYNCSNLRSIILPNTLNYIGEWAFRNSGLTSVDIPNGVLAIYQYTFTNCQNLVSVTLPDSVTSIGLSAFSGCTNLEEVVLSEQLHTIGDFAFAACDSLTSINLPSSITHIYSSAFAQSESLTAIVKENSYAHNWCSKNSVKHSVEREITLDMSAATLDKSTYAPGDTITITGIKVKNADRVHFSGNNGYLEIYDADTTNSSSYVTLGAVELSLSQYAEAGNFWVSVQAYDDNANASAIDQETLVYTVVVDGEVTPDPDCEHSPSTSTWSYTLFRLSTENSAYHIAYADVYKCVCAKCSASYEVTVEREASKQVTTEHDYNNSVCQSPGCGYGCVHKDCDDVYVRTISLTDNKDGATHTHVYSANRVCKSCKTALGMQTCTVPNEPHNIKDGEVYYITDENGHQKVTPQVCSCGCAEDSLISNPSPHSIGAINTIEKYKASEKEPEKHIWVYETSTYCADCKKLISYEKGEEVYNHTDLDVDNYCDGCKVSMSEVYKDYNMLESMERFNVPASVFDFNNIERAIFLNARENAKMPGLVTFAFEAMGWGDEIEYTVDENNELSYGAGHSATLLIDANGSGVLFEVGQYAYFDDSLWQLIKASLGQIVLESTRIAGGLTKFATYLTPYEVKALLSGASTTFDSGYATYVDHYGWFSGSTYPSSHWDNAVVFDISVSQGTRMFDKVKEVFKTATTYWLTGHDCDHYALEVLLAGLDGQDKIVIENCNSATPNGTYEKIAAYAASGKNDNIYVHNWK